MRFRIRWVTARRTQQNATPQGRAADAPTPVGVRAAFAGGALMERILIFAGGFAAGWLARSTVATSKDAAVGVAALALELVDRLKRAVTLERERMEDLAAEVRSRVGDRHTVRSQPSANGANASAAEA